jgi:hypothetical protein
MRSICSDGISYVMSDTTLNDIKNKLMIENNGNFTKPIFPNTLESDLAWQKNNVWKYQKYIDRGYQDINNILYNRIVNETSTN